MGEKVTDTTKRQMLTMRVTQDLKDRISATADANGRSVSQEIEMRLERTLYQDAELGDPEQAGFLRWLATIMDVATRRGHGSWMTDPEIFAHVRSAAVVLFEAYEPKGVELPSLDKVSQAGRAIIEQWESEIAARDAEAAVHARRATELHIKNEASGLTDEERAEMEAAFAASKMGPVSLPDLDETDSKAWGSYGRRRQLMKRVETAIVQMIVAINSARGS